jgi:DeoR/GlpR family transcriptional regulator of sugar metabolism
MRPTQRKNEILKLLRTLQRELKVEELAHMLNVSPLSIRRDLNQLHEEKTIIRTHGGCMIAGRAALETDYHLKVGHNFNLKQGIGRAAAAQVDPGSALLINDGSTTFHLATHLGQKAPLTVYTNSLAMIAELGRVRDIELYILGGKYVSDLYSLRGSLTEHILELLSIDIAFLGADAIDEEGRCLTSSPEEANLTKAMLRSGRKKILLVDHTKLKAEGQFVYGTLQEFDLWITSQGLDENTLKELGKKVEIVEAQS